MAVASMEVFIEKVREYPCIWDTNSISYRDLDKKDFTWESLARECGLENGKEARLQWKRLRDSHREALRRRRNINGQVSQISRPWKYEQLMKFLLPHGVISDTSCNCLDADDSIELPHEVNETGLSTNNAFESSLMALQLPNKWKDNTALTRILDERQKFREKKDFKHDELRRKGIEGSYRDPLTDLFASLCEKTRALPKYLQLRVQREIFNSVTCAEEESLQNEGARIYNPSLVVKEKSPSTTSIESVSNKNKSL